LFVGFNGFPNFGEECPDVLLCGFDEEFVIVFAKVLPQEETISNCVLVPNYLTTRQGFWLLLNYNLVFDRLFGLNPYHVQLTQHTI
jgi:hypothetical protein